MHADVRPGSSVSAFGHKAQVQATVIDEVFGRLVDSLPTWLAVEARALPETLRLSGGSAGWSEYATLPPIVDLPFFLAPDAVAARLEAAREAHWLGGFLGLTLDRLADNQTSKGVSTQLIQALRKAWVDSLAELFGSRRSAEQAAEETLARAAVAFRLESSSAKPASVEVEQYVRTVRDKTAWFGLASRMLWQGTRGNGTTGFDGVYQRLMLSLQTFDDGADVDEDRHLTGLSVPERLGLSPASMSVVSSELARRAAQCAHTFALGPLQRWLEERAILVLGALKTPPAPIDMFGALMFVERAEACLGP